MRRRNHLQELQQKAIEESYRAHKQNEREERLAAVRNTHKETVRQHAPESKAKKGFESGLVRLHGFPFQP